MKAVLIFALLVAVIAVVGAHPNLKIGADVPSFTLKNYDGTTYDLQTVRKAHKFTVVMFISTQCPVSNGYNERMEQLDTTYGPRGVAFLAINSNKAEDVHTIAEHAKAHGFTFPVLKDERNKVADLYGAQVTPETYVISTDGKLLYHGRIDDNRNIAKVTSHDLSDALDKLLAGKEPTAVTTKAFGCSIKRVD
jgi:peroxiredoxin